MKNGTESNVIIITLDGRCRHCWNVLPNGAVWHVCTEMSRGIIFDVKTRQFVLQRRGVSANVLIAASAGGA